MHAVSRQDIFESVEREVVGELADHHEGDQARAGDPSRYRLGRHRRAGHAVAALRAGVLGQDVDIHFELRRGELELTGEVFADAMFRAAAAGAGLLGLGQVVLDAVVGEMVERGSPLRARCLGPGSGGAVSGSVGAAASGSMAVSWRSNR